MSDEEISISEAYEILELKEDVIEKQVKDAFREKVRVHHQDKSHEREKFEKSLTFFWYLSHNLT